jgi:hypothetical protein
VNICGQYFVVSLSRGFSYASSTYTGMKIPCRIASIWNFSFAQSAQLNPYFDKNGHWYYMKQKKLSLLSCCFYYLLFASSSSILTNFSNGSTSGSAFAPAVVAAASGLAFVVE